ncbi:hypothetical protein Avbf_00528 [Armadillidium vulgare]|nr:hypothetical protein Avbf_00528 [Armadillidium vulgare]
MISNKFNKNEVKGNSIYNSQNKGTNSKDLSKSTSELNSDVTNPERFHNGENYLHENNNFQRVVTYSSLKSKLDGPPQQANTQGVFLNSGRHSGRLPYSTVNNQPSNPPYETQRSNTLSQPIVLGPKRAESCTHLGAPVPEQTPKLPQWGIHHRSDDNLTRPLASDQSYPDPVATKLKETVDGRFLPSREGRVSGSSDSGRGTGGGSASEFKGHDTSLESGSSNRNPMPGHSSGNESEWIDIPDSDEKQIQQFGSILHNSSKYPEGSKTPPLPPLSPEASPRMGGSRNSKPKKNTQSHRNNIKPDIVETTEKNSNKKSTSSSTNENSCTNQHSGGNLSKSKGFSSTGPTMGGHGMSSSGRDRGIGGPQNKFHPQQMKAREKEWRTPIDDDDDDVTSTDAALDLNSVLDGATEITTDDDLASTRDDDTYLIRRQLEGLEGMYSEVLKVLGGRKNMKASDPRLLRRKVHGSMSSLPSSVMSKSEMESIRNDISALKLNVKSPSMLPLRGGPLRGSRLWNGIGAQHPSLSNPGKVKKLTQFFGDEPPLVRIFLKKLGYEKYAPIFEQEKIGMLELPYMTEERLQKIGIPLGPRLRILEESRGPITTDGNLSVYVV